METERGLKTLEEIRKSVRVGDMVSYTRYICRTDDERLLVPVKTAVRVVRKYPYQVEVETDGRSCLPVRTITYAQLWMEEQERIPRPSGRRRKHV